MYALEIAAELFFFLHQDDFISGACGFHCGGHSSESAADDQNSLAEVFRDKRFGRFGLPAPGQYPF